jgi:two-component system CheB/CheR fusion protein
LKTNFAFHPEQLFLVGIAASAGGLKPMRDLLEKASCHGSMSFVVVNHRSRDQASDLSQILERASNIHAVEIADGMAVENCRLYLIPPDRYVVVENSRFKLLPRPRGLPNNVADECFKSLAAAYGRNAIGVVLSGASVGADGSEGVRAIKHSGGHTYAQTPETADFPDMPRLAIETGCIDTIAPPAEIGFDLSLVAWASA